MYRFFSIYTLFMFKCGMAFYILSEDSGTCGGSRTYPLHILMDDHINIFDFSFSEIRLYYVALVGLNLL